MVKIPKHIILIIITYLMCFHANASDAVPFSTDSNSLTIWNGTTYEPFFIKGTNLGVAKPGTYPGEMSASKEDYKRWIKEIKEAGFNCIRLYTLHYPHFYEELLNYNTENPQSPLLFFQGVWLNEEMDGYADDLYLLADTFKAEIKENIDCLHGNKSIAHRYGKAYGDYTANVSRWNLGYIIGREVYPDEVLTTDFNHKDITEFIGSAFSISNASATEVLITESLDHLVNYEKKVYDTERPVSFSSWPTLDPIKHPLEGFRSEDTTQVDLSKIKIIDAPAGLFISYHAYPYYPDFIGADPIYKTYSDNLGPNSYLGYLIDLKSHYKNFPLIVAEFGVPSSWGVAHYTSSGMNHGGFDEQSQGETNLRLLETIRAAKLGGGVQFSWIDEWFKNTWVTDPIDFGNKILWHNVTAAEQNFGLKKFIKNNDWELVKSFTPNDNIKTISAKANYDFFEIKLDIKNTFDILGECWVALDTYDASLGESILPNGTTVNSRAEFVVYITQYSARLYVTQAYDLFGLWHKETTDLQKHQSIITDGAPWQIVRWKNNAGYSDVQYIGELKLNKSSQPASSKDAVTIYNDRIELRIPWTLINVVDPSQKLVFHDDKSTAETETRATDGIQITVNYMNQNYATDTRFTWPTWDRVLDSDVVETFKTSYWVMQKQLIDFNTKAAAFPDKYEVVENSKGVLKVAKENGVMLNDFDIDSPVLEAVLTDAPANGFVDLQSDGSFVYIPRKGFKGTDRFKYAIFDGKDLSISTTATIEVLKSTSNYYSGNPQIFKVWPNPAIYHLTISSEVEIVNVKIFDSNGRLKMEIPIDAKEKLIDISMLTAGSYFIVSNIGGQYFSQKLIVR